jgi:hypothetical protein
MGFAESGFAESRVMASQTFSEIAIEPEPGVKGIFWVEKEPRSDIKFPVPL